MLHKDPLFLDKYLSLSKISKVISEWRQQSISVFSWWQLSWPWEMELPLLQTTDSLLSAAKEAPGKVYTVTLLVSFAVVMEAESNNSWHIVNQFYWFTVFLFSANSKDLLFEMEDVQRALNQINGGDAAAESRILIFETVTLSWKYVNLRKQCIFFLFIFL